MDSVVMSNASVEVQGESSEMLAAGLELALAIKHRITSWCVTGAGFVLYWHEHADSQHHLFPNPIATQVQVQGLAVEIQRWIEALPMEEFRLFAGQQPDIDGSVERNGFHLKSGTNSVVAIVRPIWVHVHK